MATTQQASEYVGTIGVLCGAETNKRVAQLTPSGPLRRAVCNRWHGHDGDHWMTRTGRHGFIRLATFNDDDRRTPDWREAAKRIEMATAARERRAIDPAGLAVHAEGFGNGGPS